MFKKKAATEDIFDVIDVFEENGLAVKTGNGYSIRLNFENPGVFLKKIFSVISVLVERDLVRAIERIREADPSEERRVKLSYSLMCLMALKGFFDNKKLITREYLADKLGLMLKVDGDFKSLIDDIACLKRKEFREMDTIKELGDKEREGYRFIVFMARTFVTLFEDSALSMLSDSTNL